MFYTILFLGLLQLVQVSPQQSDDNKRIHHGQLSEEPFVLFLERVNGPQSSLCTASLIRAQYILTAGHCVMPGYDKITATYACFDIRSPDCKTVAVVAAKLHPDFAGGAHTNDIAVAKLETKLSIEPISLPNGENKTWVPNGLAYTVGYGNTEAEGKQNYNQRSTSLPIMETTKDMIALRILKSRSDEGDSGGPLIINNTIYGVLIGGIVQPPTSEEPSMQIYLSVNYYRDFIDSSIEALEKGE